MRLIDRIEIPNETYDTLLCIDKLEIDNKITYNISIKHNKVEVPKSIFGRLKVMFKLLHQKDVIYSELHDIDEDNLKELVPKLLQLINSR